MWVITLSIVTLAAMLAALGYVASGTRRLDASLGTLLQEQREYRCSRERDLERVRQSAVELTTSPGC